MMMIYITEMIAVIIGIMKVMREVMGIMRRITTMMGIKRKSERQIFAPETEIGRTKKQLEANNINEINDK